MTLRSVWIPARPPVISSLKDGDIQCPTTQVPRVELTEMGPRLDLSVRRRRDAPPDLAKEAHRQPKLTGKKVGTVAPKSRTSAGISNFTQRLLHLVWDAPTDLAKEAHRQPKLTGEQLRRLLKRKRL